MQNVVMPRLKSGTISERGDVRGGFSVHCSVLAMSQRISPSPRLGSTLPRESDSCS